jgi:UDP-2-acetamido-2,6-beta-L-arabino-hexul-4-ose reductase
MIRVGITGQNGFIGTHLFNSLGLYPKEFIRIPFRKDFFVDERKLDDFVSNCDVIVHLAALNRHEKEEVLYETNLNLSRKLLDSLDRTNGKPHILFSSSTQEELDNWYGKSKKEARELTYNWACTNGAQFSGLVIPNVFGPFGKPFYNSVVTTFCYQLINGVQPTIKFDSLVKLIYIDELIYEILKRIRLSPGNNQLATIHVRPSYEIKVSDLLELLISYKKKYFELGMIPSLTNSFELNLFNTFRSFITQNTYFPRKFSQHKDSRGAFVEIIRLGVGGQVSFSTTKPGITRGNHFHTRKIERFAVIKGSALIQLRRIDCADVLDFYLNGDEPAYVDMPIWYTHNIKNTGNEELYTVFWINELYNPEDADTYFQTV